MAFPRLSAVAVAAAITIGAIGQVASAQTEPIPTVAIASAVADMQSGDRDKVMNARTALLNQLTGKSKPFLAAYAREVGRKLMPVAGGTDAHAKLNAAIVVQRLADQTGSIDLTEIITKLIRDPSPAIATYGIRASGNVLPRAMADVQLGATNQIVPAIIEAIQKNPTSESVASESYSQMTKLLMERGAVELIGDKAVATATPKTIDAVHAVLKVRLQQYGSGSVAEPAAEIAAMSFLGRQSTWQGASKQQQMETLRLLLRLMNAAAAEMDTVPAGSQMGTERERLNALRNVVKVDAQGLGVIADVMGKADLKPTLDAMKELGPASPIAMYKQRIAAVQADFVRVFPELKDAVSNPTTGGATTQPASE